MSESELRQITVRPKFTEGVLEEAEGLVADMTGRRLVEKGRGIFVSSHEIQGVLTEEFRELAEAVHRGDRDSIENELIDIAVAAVLGLASVLTNKMDWL